MMQIWEWVGVNSRKSCSNHGIMCVSNHLLIRVSQLISFKITQVENAIKQLRLSDAVDLLLEPNVRAHVRGQVLCEELGEALNLRAQTCLDSGEFEKGLTDCVLGHRLGFKMENVEAELMQGLREIKIKKKRGLGRIAVAMAEVKKGFLSRGQGMVDWVDAGNEKEGAELVIEDARFSADQAFENTKNAMSRGEIIVALKELSVCMAKHKSKEGLEALRGNLICESLSSAREMIDQGKLLELDALLENLVLVSDEHLEVKSMQALLGDVKEVEGLVLGQELREAYMVLKRLQRAWPSAKWISEAAEDTRQAADGIEKLRCGPVFGLGGGSRRKLAVTQKMTEGAGQIERMTRLSRGGEVANTKKLNQFILRIDGLGAFWVMQKETITVGLGNEGCDIGLQGQKGLPSVKIMREDEDYWVDCGDGVNINGQSVTRKVLGDGDKVVMGSRQGFVFKQPSGASSTAVLDFSQVRLKMVEVKCVILMDGVVLIGQGSDCHLRCDELGKRVMLMAGRDGYVIKVDGEATALNLGQAVSVGAGDGRLRLMIEEVASVI